MDKLKQQVASAQRRLMLQQFLAVLPWCWFGTLLVAAVAIGVQKWSITTIDAWRWAAWWLGGAMAIGLLAALAWTWINHCDEFDAASEIDRRFNLKERVSSSLALTVVELHTPCGHALLDDALQRVGRQKVAKQFPVTMPRRAWLPLAPAAIAFVLCCLSDPTRHTQAKATVDAVAVSREVHESLQQVEKKLEERAKEASKIGLQSAAEQFKKIIEEIRNLAQNEKVDRHDALAKLHDLTQELETRRKELAAGETLQQELAAMKNLPAGLADKFAQELKAGNFDQAIKELAKLQNKLASGQIDSQQRKALAQQLAAMHDALQKLVETHEKMATDLETEIDKAKQTNDSPLVKKLQENLAKLREQQPQMDAVKSLAGRLAQSAKGAQAGKIAQTQEALNQLAAQLAQTQRQADEMEMLQATLNDIDGAKMAMNGKQGGTQGSAEFQDLTGGTKGIGHHPGGEGVRTDPARAATYDAPLKQQAGKGAEVVVGEANGPNLKREVIQQIKTQMEAVRKESADPLVGQKLPRAQRDQVQQYFDAFRTGQ